MSALKPEAYIPIRIVEHTIKMKNHKPEAYRPIRIIEHTIKTLKIDKPEAYRLINNC